MSLKAEKYEDLSFFYLAFDMFFRVIYYFIVITSPAKEPYNMLFKGFDVIGQVPELHPIK